MKREIDVYFSVPFINKESVNDEELLLEIKIPRINLDEKVYNINSVYNNVDYHVEILEESVIDSNLIFLAGHSGWGEASYFNNLVFLERGDIIYIDKKKERLCFRVDESFYIDKKGYMEFFLEDDVNALFLITCSLEKPNKQLVVKSRLVEC